MSVTASLDRAPGSGPLYAQVKAHLRARIVGGALPGRSRLPGEHALTAEYGVSRITVRQALKDLEDEGLIFRVHGKGTFVSQPRATQDLTHLQGLGEAMAAIGVAIFNEVRALETLPAEASVARALGIAAGTPVVHLSRLRHVAGQPVSLEASFLPVDTLAALRRADLARRDLYEVLENDMDLVIGHAEVAIEARAADRETARALRVAEHSPLLRLERRTCDREGRPVDFDRIHFRGDAFRYQLRIERSHAPQQEPR
ncbi:GntR family transcriptional regulator [Niveibacterium sp. SC-1]|uniref:GntR family transcriptional regulator n=1 Tax=Niveibacterium sp. SC-1 TaxID=3135646 RepID=UPI00311F10F7